MDRDAFDYVRLLSHCKMNMILLFLLLIAFRAVGGSAAESPSIPAQPDSIIQEISAASSRIQSLQCTFIQTKHIAMLNDKLVSRGKIIYQQPDKLLWQYTIPYSYTFIINRQQVIIRNGQRTDVIDANRNRVFKEIARMMMNSLRGQCLTDNKSFQVTVSSGRTQGTGLEYIATLVPKRKELKQLWDRLVLHFDVVNQVVSTVEMYEKNGDHTIIQMQDVVVNKPVDAKIFNVE